MVSMLRPAPSPKARRPVEDWGLVMGGAPVATGSCWNTETSPIRVSTRSCGRWDGAVDGRAFGEWRWASRVLSVAAAQSTGAPTNAATDSARWCNASSASVQKTFMAWSAAVRQGRGSVVDPRRDPGLDPLAVRGRSGAAPGARSINDGVDRARRAVECLSRRLRLRRLPAAVADCGRTADPGVVGRASPLSAFRRARTPASSRYRFSRLSAEAVKRGVRRDACFRRMASSCINTSTCSTRTSRGWKASGEPHASCAAAAAAFNCAGPRPTARPS
mmetsp:Transcript_56400/g.150215  ORF Transcript_56400/g.150215 Transcript_56400/m.150215 type:complete len:275 (+) Transcript_56400:900-1724(+)